MTPVPAFVAVDLGAESGRVVLGRLERDRISLQEVSRFANRPILLPDGSHWDIAGLFSEILNGIGLAARDHAIQAIGIDSWGVDYGLLDGPGRLLGLPYAYRDRRTEGIEDRVAPDMARNRAYEITGIRSLPFNTVYQLLAEQDSPALQAADRIALIPDLLSYWLCGVTANERTDASTTGLLDAGTGTWALSLVQALGLPSRIFGDLVEPGTVLGPVLPANAECIGLSGRVDVVATAGHDTAAAFAGAPLRSRGAAVLSSGTWSLLGMELTSPVLTEEAQAAGLSNERGVLGTTRLLRNVMGLWLLQQCRAAWLEKGETLEYAELTRLAAAQEGEPALFDPDHPSLLYPGDMPARITDLLIESGQQAPHDHGSLVHSIFASLACRYRSAIESLERVTSTPVDTIHVVGGGSRNDYLCRLTADLTDREVLAGPAEASALGNILMQAHALGHVSGLGEMRELSHASFPPVRYRPSDDRSRFEEIYDRFLSVTGLATDQPRA
jgi:rhamnulokinase